MDVFIGTQCIIEMIMQQQCANVVSDLTLNRRKSNVNFATNAESYKNVRKERLLAIHKCRNFLINVNLTQKI